MAQAYEFDFGENNLLQFPGAAVESREEDQLDVFEGMAADGAGSQEYQGAKILQLTNAVVRHAVHEEAMQDLADVVPLEVARRAVNEAYQDLFPPNLIEGANALQESPYEAADTPAIKSPSALEASRPKLVDNEFVPTHEAVTKHTFVSRGATEADIEALVDVDMKAFEGVYKHAGMSHEELRQELIDKFRGRFEKVGGTWIRLVEKDGNIAGFMTCCPTSKTPEEFESWEKTTDNGTLETTYDPDGKNVYVVSLSMLPGVGEAARNMLFAHQIGELIKGGYERAFFESRLPGLGTWARRECRQSGKSFDELTKDEQLELAERYFSTTTVRNGKEVPVDKLIRIYTGAGCKFTRVVPDAYDDPQSMNFGAVGVFENPLPAFARNNKVLSKTAGKAVQLLSKSHWLMSKAF